MVERAEGDRPRELAVRRGPPDIRTRRLLPPARPKQGIEQFRVRFGRGRQRGGTRRQTRQFGLDPVAQNGMRGPQAQFFAALLKSQQALDGVAQFAGRDQRLHQLVERHRHDAPAAFQPAHRQQRAQHIQIFLQPYPVAVQIAPIITPRHVQVVPGAAGRGVVGGRQRRYRLPGFRKRTVQTVRLPIIGISYI